ncbi:prepilin peptidase [Sphingobium sp. HBC34]|uniref:Prepilin peptidase n=1 Tax=Sphingobium cyanobacteriorum TaxID=3063954 RepID=A0ABT8ZKA0_9SPHN|nr:prepilin peptidase [Sphingobium sp. HBC34]MDO7834622.1 prepilin peptidase [Sphingobium sp. HBC34]
MTGDFFRLALMCVLGVLLIVAAIGDLRSRIISNRLNLAVALLAPLWWLANTLSIWPDMAMQLAVGGIFFALFAGLFALGLMGGGDVKLLGALALWFPWQVTVTLFVLMSLLGGAVTIVTVIHHRMRKKQGQPEIPYGIAISIAALWILGERYLNQFA